MLLMQNHGPNTGTGFVRVKQGFKKEGNNMFIDCIDIDQEIHASPRTPPYFINLLFPFLFSNKSATDKFSRKEKRSRII